MVLKGISPIISPDLLRGLAMMGHGDEIVLADAHFPAHSIGKEGPLVIRADGVGIPALLDAILNLIELDTYVYSPVTLMEMADKDRRQGMTVSIWETYTKILEENNSLGKTVPMTYLERFKFYERAKKAFIVVQTGETALYGNIILKNGLVSNETGPESSTSSTRLDSGGARSPKDELAGTFTA